LPVVPRHDEEDEKDEEADAFAVLCDVSFNLAYLALAAPTPAGGSVLEERIADAAKPESASQTTPTTSMLVYSNDPTLNRRHNVGVSAYQYGSLPATYITRAFGAEISSRTQKASHDSLR
jgi:hypothetical protein